MDNQITYAEAINYFGSAARMAKRLGIKPQAVYQWNEKLPPLRLYQIKEIIEAEQGNDESFAGANGRATTGEKSHVQTIEVGN
jgi:hypothetical protein